MQEENKVEEVETILVDKQDFTDLVDYAKHMEKRIQELETPQEVAEIGIDLSGFREMLKIKDEVVEEEKEGLDSNLYHADGTLKEDWEVGQ